MRPTGESKVFTVEVIVEEGADETEAKAVVDIGGRHFGGWGRARRNPDDPEMPRVGEELAIARAVSDLSHHLLDAAAMSIEQWSGGGVRVHG